MDYSEYDTPARLKWGLRAFFALCKEHSEKAALEALACELEGVDPVNPIVANGERLALQQARLEYYAQAVRLREANPALPELPPITQDNPHGDLVALEHWCGDVKPELPATPPAPPPDGGETPAGVGAGGKGGKPTKPGAEGAGETPPFTPIPQDIDILAALAKRETRCHGLKLGVVGVGQKLLGERLPALEKHGLVDRNEGKKRGWAITAAGCARLPVESQKPSPQPAQSPVRHKARPLPAGK